VQSQYRQDSYRKDEPGAEMIEMVVQEENISSMQTASVSLRIIKFYRRFEQLIVMALLFLLSLVILYATIQFASAIFNGLYNVASHYLFRRSVEEIAPQINLLHEVFSQFLLILIGIELMKTIMMYLEDHAVHVEVVLTVAIIAIARHAIDVDYKTTSPMAVIGLGLLVLALTVGYYLFKKADKILDPTCNPASQER
jgi:uncharacterized membrane protein (DUF373 family)